MRCIYWPVNARAPQNARAQSCIESTFESRSIIRLVIPLYANRPQGIYDAQSLQKSVARSIAPQFSTGREAVLRNTWRKIRARTRTALVKYKEKLIVGNASKPNEFHVARVLDVNSLVSKFIIDESKKISSV